MRPDGQVELGRHQQHSQDLVQAAKPAGVDLNDVDRTSGDELLEQNAVLMLWTAPTQRWGSMAASSSQEPRSSP
jgi:hypothetical protein